MPACVRARTLYQLRTWYARKVASLERGGAKRERLAPLLSEILRIDRTRAMHADRCWICRDSCQEKKVAEGGVA